MFIMSFVICIYVHAYCTCMQVHIVCVCVIHVPVCVCRYVCNYVCICVMYTCVYLHLVLLQILENHFVGFQPSNKMHKFVKTMHRKLLNWFVHYLLETKCNQTGHYIFIIIVLTWYNVTWHNTISYIPIAVVGSWPYSQYNNRTPTVFL